MEPRVQSRILASALLFLVGVAGVGARAEEPAAGAKEIRIAAAADLEPVMPVLAQMYKRKTGIDLKVSFGSSGTLTTQIMNGAPFDVFLGADFVFPEKLVAAGLTEARKPTAYAKGRLVVFVLNASPVKPLSVEKLTDPRIEKIAIADRERAPFGRAAVAALTQLKLMDKVESKLVVAENVAQAGQFVVSGNAQAGLISLTLASSEQYKKIGRYAVVPDAHPEILQCGVVLKSAKDAGAAKAFLDWMLSSEIQSNLHNVGLEPVR